MNPHWPDNFLFAGHHHHHQKPLHLPPFMAASKAPAAPVPAQGNNNGNGNNPLWVDEFLDFSHAKRSAHRRSASDSIAFLDSASLLEDACRLGAGAGNNPASAGPGSNADSGSDFDRFDDEQFMSMFTDEISPPPVNKNNDGTAAGPPVPVSSSNPSTPTSDHNSINEEKQLSPQPLDHQFQTDQQMATMMKNEAEEANSPCESDTTTQAGITAGAPSTATANATGSSERIFDPKRVKRILANRQSAQRSRVRKLQYISELERSVTSLQAEVSVLSPRVAFLDHQRLLLSIDNGALKQRIAALAQDKIFKDAHQEALKREIERLRQVYSQQNLKNMDNNNAAPPSSQPPISDVPTTNTMEEQLAS
ncbi:hypothetical protein CRG98_036874 [Punica granatum]|nr:hypothetical protein CRG98_036874 [Punica granatum]